MQQLQHCLHSSHVTVPHMHLQLLPWKSDTYVCHFPAGYGTMELEMVSNMNQRLCLAVAQLLTW